MILKIKTIPNAKKEEIQKISDFEYRIKLTQPPENDKANNRLIKIISQIYNVPTSSIKIKNQRSRNKIISID